MVRVRDYELGFKVLRVEGFKGVQQHPLTCGGKHPCDHDNDPIAAVAAVELAPNIPNSRSLRAAFPLPLPASPSLTASLSGLST